MNREPSSTRFLVAAAIFASLASGQEVKRPRILGVAHIAFYAHDIERSRAFYTGMCGFQEPYSLKNPNVDFFKVNDHQYVELFPEKEPNTDRLVNIGLETDNADQLRKYLISRGVPVPDRVTKNRIGNRTFTVTDPDKHTVEFVQYEPGGRTMREKGKFMDDHRISAVTTHVGIMVKELDPAMKFYHDILGFTEITRTAPKEKPGLVYMKVPDGESWVEFMMIYDQVPNLARMHGNHHMGLMVETDLAKNSIAIFEASPAYKSYTRPPGTTEVRGTPPWQFQIYDPDGSRLEVMLPGVAGRGPSTPPPAK
jgi:lactoylglutathione lyase